MTTISTAFTADVTVGAPPQRSARRVLPWVADWFSYQPRNARIVDSLTALTVMVVVGFPFQLRPDWSYFFAWEAVPVWCLFLVAVALRRLSPWMALACAAVGLLAKWMIGLPLHAMDVAVPIVFFTCAARGSRLLFAVSGVCAVLWPTIQAVYSAFFEMQLPFLDRVTGRAALGPTELLTPIGIIGIPLVLMSLIVWASGGILRVQRISSRVQHAAELAELEYLQTQEELVREQERNYIARDMHDVVAHSLAVIVAQADGGRYLMKTTPESVAPVLSTISETARDALVEVRGLLGRLRHSQSDAAQKTLEDLPAVFDRVRQAGMDLRVYTDGEPMPLTKSGEVAVFRMVQECLTNALKYGSINDPVTVTMLWHNEFRIEIENRVSAESLANVGGSGHGLIGMRERLLVVGGTMEYALVDDQWVVIATVPLQQDRVSATDPGIPRTANIDTISH